MISKTPVLRSKLRHLKHRITTDSLLLYAKYSSSIPQTFPDFLGIGPTRSATGWLFQRLSLHPDIFIPSIKEVCFFDRRTDDKSKFFFDLGNQIHWKWYNYHFKNGINKVKGEISPSYSILNEERIREISLHLPKVKLIYSIRNPIDRTWSGLRFRLWYGKGTTATAVSNDEIMKMLEDTELTTRSYHKQTIERWEKYFSEDKIHFVFCDDIINDPRNVLVNLCNYLNVDPVLLPDEDNDHRRVNTVSYSDAPTEIADFLRNMFSDQIVYIENKFNRDLKNWYD